jgi:hypothetical protein
MAAKTGLTSQQQGILLFLAFFLVPLIAWLSLGAPTDRTALSMLGAGLVSGVLAYIKEALGTSAPTA